MILGHDQATIHIIIHVGVVDRADDRRALMGGHKEGATCQKAMDGVAPRVVSGAAKPRL